MAGNPKRDPLQDVRSMTQRLQVARVGWELLQRGEPEKALELLLGLEDDREERLRRLVEFGLGDLTDPRPSKARKAGPERPSTGPS